MLLLNLLTKFVSQVDKLLDRERLEIGGAVDVREVFISLSTHVFIAAFGQYNGQ